MSFDSLKPKGELPSAPVVFTLAELWLMNDVIRHEVPQGDGWKFPPASLDLNDAIAFGIESCYSGELNECVIYLTRHDCLVIDANIRRDMKTAEGAKGWEILLNSFRARKEIETGLVFEPNEFDIHDRTYQEVKDRAATYPDTDSDAGTDQDAE